MTQPPTIRPPSIVSGPVRVLDANDVGSLAEGNYHGDYAILFKESESVLTEDVVARFYPTLVGPDDAFEVVIARGTTVCTFVVRFHPTSGFVPIDFTVDLGAEILGETDLSGNVELRHPAVGYAESSPIGHTDFLHFDGSSLSARLSDKAGRIDEARIFIAC